MSKLGAPRKKEGWITRCGQKFEIRIDLKMHHKNCLECLKIKQSNIQERQNKLNKSEKQRQKSSIAAKRTSSRPDIIEKRSQALKKWRDANPEVLRQNLSKGQTSIKNRPRAEFWFRKNYADFPEKKVLCIDIRKMIDIVTDDGLWVEIDGFFHFFAVKSNSKYPSRHNRLQNIQDRDRKAVEQAKIDKRCFIRLSMDCFVRRTGELKEIWKPIVQDLINKKPPGVWCLGKLYEYAPWAKDGCTILKFPITSTDLLSLMG